MHDGVEDGAVAFRGRVVAEDAPAERGPVEGAAFARGPALAAALVGGWEEEVGCCGGEVRDDAVVAGGAGLDDFAGEQVGVDDGEVVGWLGEEGGDGRFAGCDGAGEAYEEHLDGSVPVPVFFLAGVK